MLVGNAVISFHVVMLRASRRDDSHNPIGWTDGKVMRAHVARGCVHSGCAQGMWSQTRLFLD